MNEDSNRFSDLRDNRPNNGLIIFFDIRHIPDKSHKQTSVFFIYPLQTWKQALSLKILKGVSFMGCKCRKGIPPFLFVYCLIPGYHEKKMYW